MSKIYIVISNCGSYDTYYEKNERAFVNQRDAEIYAKELDALHLNKPQFVTDEFEVAFNGVLDDLTIGYEDDYPYENENKLIIEHMYKKGFMITEQMLETYEKWRDSQYDEWGECKIEEIELI